VLVAVVFAASTALAQSASSFSTGSIRPPGAPPINKPIDLEIEAPSTDFMQDVTQLLNDIHYEYLGLKRN
jgi:hypothetical protein